MVEVRECGRRGWITATEAGRLLEAAAAASTAAVAAAEEEDEEEDESVEEDDAADDGDECVLAMECASEATGRFAAAGGGCESRERVSGAG